MAFGISAVGWNDTTEMMATMKQMVEFCGPMNKRRLGPKLSKWQLIGIAIICALGLGQILGSIVWYVAHK
ncbi:hypothetical protein [Ensifer sp. B1-9]|uniref:hypothetical protein n=1 Tax=Ensifer sp. B1-9 TaxID=3141455 RepID=UPI003D211B02